MDWSLFGIICGIVFSFLGFGLAVTIEMKKTRKDNKQHAVEGAVKMALIQKTLNINSEDTKDIKATLGKQDTRLDKITVNIAKHEIRLCNLEKFKEREERR